MSAIFLIVQFSSLTSFLSKGTFLLRSLISRGVYPLRDF